MNGNAISWSSAGSLGFKGSRKGTPFAAQSAADTAARARQRARLRSRRSLCEGPRRRQRIRHPRARGGRSRDHDDHRRFAHRAQRLQAPEAPQSISIRRERNGNIQRFQVPPLPQRGRKALSEGRQVLFHQVRVRAPSGRARRTRRGQEKGLRVRAAAARKAEDQAHLRRAGGPVPQIL